MNVEAALNTGQYESLCSFEQIRFCHIGLLGIFWEIKYFSISFTSSVISFLVSFSLPRKYLLQVVSNVSSLFFCSFSNTEMEGGGCGVVGVVEVVEIVDDFLPPGRDEYLGILLSMYFITFWYLLDPNPEDWYVLLNLYLALPNLVKTPWNVYHIYIFCSSNRRPILVTSPQKKERKRDFRVSLGSKSYKINLFSNIISYKTKLRSFTVIIIIYKITTPMSICQ